VEKSEKREEVTADVGRRAEGEGRNHSISDSLKEETI